MINKPLVIIISILCFGIISCKNEDDKVPAPDVSSIEIENFKWIRFDKEVSKLNPNNISVDYKKLLVQYPYMTDLYFKDLLNVRSINQDTFYHSISQILNAKEVKAVQDTINYFYSETDDIEKQVYKSCQYLEHYFPRTTAPNFYTFFTEFGYQNVLFKDGEKDAVGIGLDMFLGKGFDYKYLDPTNPSFSEYLSRTYNKDHIVKKSMEIFVLDLLGDPPGSRFVDQVIHNGKKLFILEHLLPEISDTIILEYSKTQMDWCKKNELEMWSFFLDKEMIYETDQMKFNKYVNTSPNSPGMPALAPGQTGNYIGWKMVKAFMKRNPDKSLEDLVSFRDSQKLMEMSKYKPKRR